MGHREHKREAPKTVSLAVISISDSRTLADDESGSLIVNTLKDNGLPAEYNTGFHIQVGIPVGVGKEDIQQQLD